MRVNELDLEVGFLRWLKWINDTRLYEQIDDPRQGAWTILQGRSGEGLL